MIRLIHLADLHLGWQPRFFADAAFARAYAEERFGVFAAAVEYAADPANGIGALLVAGDLFDDHRPAPALVERVIAGLAGLTARGVVTVVVPGNHDEITYPDSVYRKYAARWPGILATSPEVTLLGSARCGGEMAHFYGMAYTGGVTDVSRPIASFPRGDQAGLHIAVLHGTVVGGKDQAAPGWAMAERSLPLAAGPLAAAKYDYIALGHIHRPDSAGIPGGAALYAGLAAGRGFDDPGCGYLTVVEVTGGAAGGGPALCRVPLALRRFVEVEVDLAGPAAVDAVLAAASRPLAAVPDGSIVRLRLGGQVDGAVDVEPVATALQARGTFAHLEVVDGTSLTGPVQLQRWASEVTVRGFFVRRLLGLDGAGASGGDGPPERDPRLVERALRHGLAALSSRGRR